MYKRQLHKKLYSGTGDVAAYNGNVSSDESHGIIERQADTLASACLLYTSVAVEQYGFCPDLDQNEDGSIGSLADVLWQSTVWYFWWD